eukprot:CAMPEP_0114610798 /NCGR_PEP_ID=MMETSP0168-20121206/3787_1 /TAXON_ID=95228 ORGANISM="Vannella sp., Strain DIVA3 517/6/12" /NCGR_SAMPLE_ID=MMETSP0168 /ASSEMBLY_ACC=CAM_ASM_000044 /LENGTH=881 /DNA_ID=CAMNT_0001821753 /DNA_START=49 /DNA_END=2691 /DNA_ORIENTATION=+
MGQDDPLGALGGTAGESDGLGGVTSDEEEQMVVLRQEKWEEELAVDALAGGAFSSALEGESVGRASDSLLGSADELLASPQAAPDGSGTAAAGGKGRGRLGRFARAATKYSIPGDSRWNNFKRNVWCNVSNGVRVVYHKLTEPVDRGQGEGEGKTATKRLPYDIVDVYKTIEDPHIFNSEMNEEFRKKNIFIRLGSFVLMEQSWLLLLLLGCFCATTAVLLDWCVDVFTGLRDTMMQELEEHCTAAGCGLAKLCAWVAFCVFFCSLSGILVRVVSPQAAGSGLPEMKSILSGVVLPRYLSFRTYIAKLTGLTCALVGGLSIGTEGPFVHIAAIIAAQLSKVTIFKRIRSNEALRFQMLSAGCAVGVSSIFGAPVGGVLFAIEVTTTYFLMQNLWKSFFCAVAGTLIVKIGGQSGLLAMFATEFPTDPYRYWELVVFVFIGCFFGYLGSLFVKFVLKLVHIRRDYRLLAETRYIQLLVIAAVTAIVVYPFDQGSGTKGIINSLFSDEKEAMEPWHYPNLYVTLVGFMVVKFFMTAVSLGLPVPCGLYTPVFMMGAAGGRLVGELVSWFFVEGYIHPGCYAVVGAAAMSAGVTRTLSTAVIVFELTGQMALLIPVLIAVIIATAVGNIFSAGVYETLLEQKRLPYMPPFGNLRMPSNCSTAGDLMRKDVVFLTATATYNDLSELLDNYRFASFPVVASLESRVLRGEVSRAALVEILEQKDLRFSETVEAQVLHNISQVMSPGETVQRLKSRYRFAAPREPMTSYSPIVSKKGTLQFASDESDESDFDVDDDGDGDYAEVESDLANRRRIDFDAPIAEELQQLPSSELDLSPFQVPEATQFYRIHFMFAMLGLNHAFITRNGKLIGVITKKDFMENTRNQILW